MPTRHRSPIRELLANNTRARCHLQLLPFPKALIGSGLFSFIPSFMRLAWKTGGLCVFVVFFLNMCLFWLGLLQSEDSRGESKQPLCVWCWTQVVLNTWDQLVSPASLILLTFRPDVAWPQPGSSTIYPPTPHHHHHPSHLINFGKWWSLKARWHSRHEGKVLMLVLQPVASSPLKKKCIKKKRGYIPYGALWGISKPHVCQWLGIEIKACQEKLGRSGGEGCWWRWNE